ncbi:YeeE/YedE family protein [Alkalilacustris brevis]|uniref:YeeE/YedE family protein n=1 Tax=Alkalilacustris brevis TaxID=2026338 RepID=UPI000E0D68C8|nr:YeeE/YedE family protein [Alkalilacustris brevis]
MFESLGIEIVGPRGASVILGAAVGLVFGALALITGFCLRRAVAGSAGERLPAAALWLVVLAAAVTGTQAAVWAGLIDFAGHRFVTPVLPLGALVAGGGLFGVGMVLARGCSSRLTVLAGTGNLRAVLVVLVLAVVAMASLRGVLAPARLWLSGLTLRLEGAGAGTLPGPGWLWVAALVLAALVLARRLRLPLAQQAMGVGLGLTVPAAWVGTGLVLQDDFDPIPFESLSLIGPWADSLFFVLASSAVNAGFGAGLTAGVLMGSLLAAVLTGRFRWQSFASPRDTGRYLLGGALMGFGGATAGGCTVGAGLTGVSTLGISAIVALGAIIAGGWLTARLVR